MEFVGFAIMLIGMGGMDSEGDMWYLACAMIFVGATMIYITERRQRMSSLATYRRQAKRAAIDLDYGDDVVEAIRKAKTEAEICRIMITARHERGYIWR